MLETAAALMRRVERALRFYRYAAAAGAVVIALLAAGGAGLYETQLGQCQAGNAYRAADQANWDDFIAVALGAHPAAGARAQAAVLRSEIHARDTPRPCPALRLP
jgi:hypothetical protein